jgi:hypothetical protein
MAMTADSRAAAATILSADQTSRENNEANQESANVEPAHSKYPFRQLEVPIR